jgi:hypothetical protein
MSRCIGTQGFAAIFARILRSSALFVEIRGFQRRLWAGVAARAALSDALQSSVDAARIHAHGFGYRPVGVAAPV